MIMLRNAWRIAKMRSSFPRSWEHSLKNLPANSTGSSLHVISHARAHVNSYHVQQLHVRAIIPCWDKTNLPTNIFRLKASNKFELSAIEPIVRPLLEIHQIQKPECRKPHLFSWTNEFVAVAIFVRTWLSETLYYYSTFCPIGGIACYIEMVAFLAWM